MIKPTQRDCGKRCLLQNIKKGKQVKTYEELKFIHYSIKTVELTLRKEVNRVWIHPTLNIINNHQITLLQDDVKQNNFRYLENW